MKYPIIDLVQTGIRVWETHVDGTLYDRVLKPLVAFLRRSGWKVIIDPVRNDKRYRHLHEKYWLATKGELFMSVEAMGRVLELEMWQERYNRENPHGGRYDFQKRSRMPPFLRRQCDLETIRIVEWLAERTGYQAEDRRYLRESVDQMIDRDIRSTGHFRPELWHAQFAMACNRTSADGLLIEHGMACWCRDRKGRILRGTVFYRLNSNWWIRLSHSTVMCVDASDIYVRQPEELRVRRNERLRAERLRSELAKAVEAENYQRAHVLKGLRDATKPKVEQAQKGTKAAA